MMREPVPSWSVKIFVDDTALDRAAVPGERRACRAEPVPRVAFRALDDLRNRSDLQRERIAPACDAHTFTGLRVRRCAASRGRRRGQPAADQACRSQGEKAVSPCTDRKSTFSGSKQT